MIADISFWAYLAGFIDGEGTLGIYVTGPRLMISSTDREIVEWFRQCTGVGAIKTYAGTSLNAKDSYRWIVTPGGIRRILPKVYPYLRLKRGQADILLLWMEGLTHGGKLLTAAQHTQRQELRDRIRVLNRRGKVLEAHVGVSSPGYPNSP